MTEPLIYLFKMEDGSIEIRLSETNAKDLASKCKKNQKVHIYQGEKRISVEQIDTIWDL